ncbi:MAG: BtrH N-terminal domain-containing protein [Chloroflexota bacterium]
MPTLENFDAFTGYYWQTASIASALQYQGVTMPHTGKPISEALLFGVSGGMNFGYFFFHYEGYDPQVNILTRNTFNLFEPILERLGIPYESKQTNSTNKGESNVVDALENGQAPIVWADMYHLPYYGLEYDEGNWAMMPMVVYGIENDKVCIADRAKQGLTVSSDDFATARARVKKDRHRIVTLDAPNPDKLASAVSLGLWDCIKLFTEKPPKGSAKNFGFKAYHKWIELLTKPKAKGSWAKTLPRGRELFVGLTTAFNFSMLFGKDTSHTAERYMMADFLEEAATILEKPALADIAPTARRAGDAWREMGNILLPDDVPLLKEMRENLTASQTLFFEQGADSTEKRIALRDRREALKQASEDYPLNEEEIVTHQEKIAEQVAMIRDIEHDLITDLRGALS